MKKSSKKERQARLNRKNKRAVVYIRFSSNMQRDGYSIEYQKEQAMRYMERKGYTFVRFYIDEAKTAKKTAGRESFHEMMSEINNDMFDVIIVFSFNRAFRNTRDALNCHFEIFDNHGIVLESITEQVDMTSPHGKSSAIGLFNMHELSSIITAEHVKAGMFYAVQKGYYIGGKVPFGYKTYETGERSRYAMKRKYAIDEKYADVVKEIFELSAKGLGNYAISRHLYNAGIVRDDGYRLTADIIRTMLKNRFYIGEAVYDFDGYETLTVKGEHPAIISEELFEASLKALNERRNNTTPRQQKDDIYPYALTGMVFCGKCGHRLYGRTTKLPYKYYVCRNRTNYADKCSCKIIRCQSLEAEVLKAIREHILNDDAIKAIAKSVLPMIGKTDTKKRREELLKRESELTESIKDLVKQKQKKIITEDILDELSAEYSKELASVKKALDGLKQPSAITAEDIEEYLYTFMEYDTAEGSHERYLLFNAFVEKIVINADEVEIHLRVSPFQHNTMFGGSIIPLCLKSKTVAISTVESNRHLQNRKE